jgi:hypothetical protein
MSRLPDRVSAAVLCYLAAPVLVFFLGWLKPIPGIALAGLLVWAVDRLCADMAPGESSKRSLAVLSWLLGVAFAWSALGGAGHLVYANTDWRTRDAVYADLILSTWPPSYGMDAGVDLVLRSATGFFLAPAAMAKLTGLALAPALLLAWCTLGVFLFFLMLPLPSAFNRRLLLLSLAVVLFSGMDYAAIVLVHGQTPVFPLPLEWWRPWTYTSLTGQLFWAPNHAIPLWLGTVLIFRHRESPDLPGIGLMLLTLLLFWTPFTIGLVPWLAWALWQRGGTPASALGSIRALHWVAAVGLGTLGIAYLSLPGIGTIPLHLGSGASTGGWSLPDTMLAYIQFAAFEFALLALLLRPSSIAMRQALGLAVALLLLLPLIRIGPSNDWMLRMSTPCLIMLLLLAMAEFDRPANDRRQALRRACLLIALGTGAITPLFEFARALTWQRTPPNYGHTLIEQQGGYRPPHYLGRLDVPALQSLFRPPSPVPAGPARRAVMPVP